MSLKILQPNLTTVLGNTHGGPNLPAVSLNQCCQNTSLPMLLNYGKVLYAICDNSSRKLISWKC